MNPIEKLKAEVGEKNALCSPLINDNDFSKEANVIALMLCGLL